MIEPPQNLHKCPEKESLPHNSGDTFSGRMDKSDVSLASQRFSEFWAAPLLVLLSVTCSACWCSESLYGQQHGFHPFGNSLGWVLPRKWSRRLPDLIIHGHSCVFCSWLWFGSLWACFIPFQNSRKKLAVLAAFLVHWEDTVLRVYESSFCSCNDTAALKPQHQLNIKIRFSVQSS